MKINSINFNIPKISGQISPFKPKGNLAPLQFDTVSFKGKEPKTNTDAHHIDPNKKDYDHSDRTTLRLSRKLYDESEYAFGILNYYLKKTFDMHVLDIDSEDFEKQLAIEMHNNRNKPIAAIVARRKKPESISEKMAQEHLRNIPAAKENLHDLIGARIILNGNSTAEGDYVLDKMGEDIAKKHIKIAQIKKHGQPQKGTNYVTDRKRRAFVDKVRKTNNPLCKYTDSPRESGYLALHIITEDIADGFRAEIQIMDKNVECFKSVEDIIYKCMFDKNVPKKYAGIKALIDTMKDTPGLKENFLEYTRRAYAYERQKGDGVDPVGDTFLSIPPDLLISPTLDFNSIAAMKQVIDYQSKKEGAN